MVAIRGACRKERVFAVQADIVPSLVVAEKVAIMSGRAGQTLSVQPVSQSRLWRNATGTSKKLLREAVANAAA